MHKQKSMLQNNIHKILPDFEIQTDHPIPSRKSDLVLIYKKKKGLIFLCKPELFEIELFLTFKLCIHAKQNCLIYNCLYI